MKVVNFGCSFGWNGLSGAETHYHLGSSVFALGCERSRLESVKCRSVLIKEDFSVIFGKNEWRSLSFNRGLVLSRIFWKRVNSPVP